MSAGAPHPRVRVTTPAGDLVGAPVGDRHPGVWCFRGVRFGRAERWMPPVPEAPWTGVRDAFEFGDCAPQNPGLMSAGLGPQSEDCLSCSVWTPAPEPGANLPVMVWIHGGGFTGGAGSLGWYDGAALAARGVVVVTCNYRLGALGFCALPGVDPNLGLRDQLLALRWVGDSIAGFGGDPAAVTLFGESAGAMSVACHLVMPASQGLFRRAICQSGAGQAVHTPESAAEMADRFLNALGGPTPGAGDDSHGLADILAAQATITANGRSFLPFQPTVDGDLLPVDPRQGVDAGASSEVDLLIGTTADEMRLFTRFAGGGAPTTHERVRKRVAAEVGAHRAQEVIDTYRGRLGDASPEDLRDAILSDSVFRQPAIRLAEAHAGRAADDYRDGTWMYLFAEPSTAFDGRLGAAHAVEVPFVFDNLDVPGVSLLVGEIDDARRSLARAMADAWVLFAGSGNPGWDPYQPWGERLTRWWHHRDTTVVADPRAAERRVWINGELPGT